MTGAEYVLLCLPVESCDGVEGRVEAVNLNPLAVGLEALDHHGLDKHCRSYQVSPAGSSARNENRLSKRDVHEQQTLYKFPVLMIFSGYSNVRNISLLFSGLVVFLKILTAVGSRYFAVISTAASQRPTSSLQLKYYEYNASSHKLS